MTLSKRAKFCLKAALTVTFPLWVIPFVFGAAIYIAGWIIWSAVSDIVDGPSVEADE